VKQLFLVLLLPVALSAQLPVWELGPRAVQLSEQAARLRPLLADLSPDEWMAKGAPPSYVALLGGAQQELNGFLAAAAALDQQPRRLTAALDTYFRLQQLEWRVETLVDAVRRYQTPVAGDTLLSVLRSNSANRDALREYIAELAARKEQEFSLINQDNQSCRAELASIPTLRRRNTARTSRQ
jgi:hypothetical protein